MKIIKIVISCTIPFLMLGITNLQMAGKAESAIELPESHPILPPVKEG